VAGAARNSEAPSAARDAGPRLRPVVILSSPTIARSGAQLSNLATREASTYHPPSFGENVDGGLSHGVWTEPYETERKHVASIAARILKGAKPGDLPIERPTQLELVINLKDRQGPSAWRSPPIAPAAGRIR